MSSLISIVSWSRKLACEILQPGDLAVDLTAGKGRDTLALARAVGQTGQVLAFDLQTAAIEQTTALLQSHDFEVNFWPVDQTLPEHGIYLVQACHSTLGAVLNSSAKVIMANLGYLPGGDQSLVTRATSTLAALQHSLSLLVPGGRLLVTIYPSHPGGEEESEVVDDFFCRLPRDQWPILSLHAANRSEAPYLLVAERKS